MPTDVPGLPFPVALAAPTVSPPPFPGGPQRATRTLYRLSLSKVGGDDLLSLPMASLECRRRLGSVYLAGGDGSRRRIRAAGGH
jgi:hypothetical protein